MLATLLSGLLLLVAGCGEQEPESRSEPVQMGPAVVWAESPADVRSGLPEVGSCHRLARDVTNGSDVAVEDVPCTEPHTSITYLADVIPDDVDDRLERWVADRCTRALPRAAGLDDAELPGAFVEWVWLQPDQELRERGARWFRCEIRSSRPGDDSELPSEGLPVFASGLPEAWLRCVDTTGAEPRFVGCDRSHQFRWTGSVTLARDTHPTAREWEQLAASRCRALVGPDAFWFTYPNQAQWRDGDRRLSCYRKA